MTTPVPDPRVVAAWQGALAAEQQAVYGYALVGAHLVGTPLVSLVNSCVRAHTEQVVGISAAMAAQGFTPQPPHADYPGLYPVTSAAGARSLAVRLEDDCATAWRYLYAATATPVTSGTGATAGSASSQAALRATAQAQLTASAVRAVRWRQASGAPNPTVAFPGL